MSLADHDGNSSSGDGTGPAKNIGLPPQDVLPRLLAVDLLEPLRRIPADELPQVLRDRLIPIVSLPGLRLDIACGGAALEMARRTGRKVVGFAEGPALLAAARAVHGQRLLAEATTGLARRHPAFSARRRLTDAQGAILVLLLLCFGTLAVALPLSWAWSLLSLASGLLFLGVVALRILCLMPLRENEIIRPAPLAEHDLPSYSVLVPLFRETSVLNQLLDALTALDYPRHLLDIKLILEETDTLMQRAVAGIRLPPEFEVIVVPAGQPQTKPRALNYAFQFCRGELVTIYDAEDIPDTDQLRKAAECFAFSHPDVACLQAQLTFYNPAENWLTRQFTLEYASLFGILLPVLANHRLPLLLGGTSNHFRAEALRAVGGWDPYNVTEDADLGLRLARQGYDCATLDSFTAEEANTKLLNWMRQRARWLKGFLVTWLVHMRNPPAFFREVGPAGFWAAQAMTFGVFASALLHPLCIAVTAALYFIYPMAPEGASIAVVTVAGVNLFVLAAGYAATVVIGWRALALQGFHGWFGTFASLPLYWLLMSCAAWYGLWQFVTAPFHWNKTEHGLSRQRRLERRRNLQHGTSDQ